MVSPRHGYPITTYKWIMPASIKIVTWTTAWVCGCNNVDVNVNCDQRGAGKAHPVTTCGHGPSLRLRGFYLESFKFQLITRILLSGGSNFLGCQVKSISLEQYTSLDCNFLFIIIWLNLHLVCVCTPYKLIFTYDFSLKTSNWGYK